MSRVLVTGASGFVGRNALAPLVAAGHEVHAVARRPPPATAGVSWHAADLLSSTAVIGQVEPEILLHLAWYAEHGLYWSSIENVRWVEASLALLRAFVAAGGRRAVMTGTCAEYDWSGEFYPEDAALRPATLYGAAKQGLHTVAGAFAVETGISLAWARLFFLYGPSEAPGRFVPSLILPLLQGSPARMSPGTQRRDFLHVADAGSALARLAGGSLEGSVNVASGEGVALREIGELLARSTGAEALLEVGALPMREDDPESIVAGVSRLRDELGWRPEIGLEDGLQRTVEWWRAQDEPV